MNIRNVLRRDINVLHRSQAITLLTLDICRVMEILSAYGCSLALTEFIIKFRPLEVCSEWEEEE